MKDIKKISNFIERDLTKKILEDNWDYKIGLERDFEHSIFYHIQNFLKAERLDKKFRMATNYSIYGTDIVLQDEKGKWAKNQFIMPDIVIRNIPKKESEPDKLYIAMELKNQDPDGPRESFSSRTITNDFRKLNGLIQEKQIDHGYFCYLYFDEERSNRTIKDQIRNARFPVQNRKNSSKLYSSITLLAINRYNDLKNKPARKNKIENLRKIYAKTFNYYKGERPIISKDQTRSDAGHVAWNETMYKPDWHVERIKNGKRTTKSRQILGTRMDLAKKIKKKLVRSGINVPRWLERILSP
jgi:hypothetical protein